MSLIVTFNGANYIIPQTNEVGWGANLDAYFVAIAAGALQKTGGLFTLSAEADFGSSFGLKSLYYKSRSSNIATGGIIRLNNNSDEIAWRNAANSSNLRLLVNTSDQLIFNGIPLVGNSFTADRAIISNGSGALAVSIVTATELGYNSGVTSAIQTQLDNKLSLSGGTLTGTLVLPAGGVGTPSLNLGDSATGLYRPALDHIRITSNSADRADFGPVNTTLYSTGGTLIVDTTEVSIASIPLHVTNFTNQLVLGQVRTVTINAPTPATSSRIWTIPDITSDATFVALEGTQTFTGIKSFSQNITLASTKALILTDNSTNTVTVKATNSTTSYTFSLPTTAGTNGYILSTDGSGNTSWIASSGSGTVNSGTAGRLSLYNTSTNAVSDTYVQNANNINIAIATHATLAATRTYTIPDSGASASFVMTEGNQTINATKTFAGFINASNFVTITPVSNQLVLGTTRTVTLSAPTPATASRTYTFPDLGGDYSVVGTIGAQTLSGAITLTSTSGLIISASQDATTQLQIINGNNTSAAASNLVLKVGGTSASDAFISLLAGASTDWTFGMDTSDSQAFKITNGVSFGSTYSLKIPLTNGNVILKGTPTNDSPASGEIGEVISSYISTSTNFPTSGQYGDLTSISLTAGDWLVTAMVCMSNNGATVTDSQIGISTTSGNSGTGLNIGDNALSFLGPNANADTAVTVANYHVQLSGTTIHYLKYLSDYTSGPPKARGRINAQRIR